MVESSYHHLMASVDINSNHSVAYIVDMLTKCFIHSFVLRISRDIEPFIHHSVNVGQVYSSK